MSPLYPTGSSSIVRPFGAPLGVLALAVLLTVLVSACTRERRHEALTFFFDGVPPLDAPLDPAGSELAALPQTSAERIEALGYNLKVTRTVTHKPVADRQCSSCHEVNDTGRPAGSWVSGTAMLRMPVEELCLVCHPQEDPVRHGPAASGQCVICHHPHASQNPHLLRLAEPQKTCVQCHLTVDIASAAEHAGSVLEQSCLECHDPHGGSQRGFLRGPALGDKKIDDPSSVPSADPVDPEAVDPGGEDAKTGRGGDGDR